MNTPGMPYAFFNNRIVPIEEAKVSIMTKTLQYGIGVFGGIRGYYNQDQKILSIFRIEDHLKRFVSSVNIFGTTIHYSESELKNIIFKLVEKNSPQTDCYFRPFAYAADTTITPTVNAPFDVAIYMIPLGDYIPTNKGLSVTISTWRRISDNAIPSRGKIIGAYANSALARKDATLMGFDEAIMLNEVGHVAEGTAENIFIVRDGVLVTPSKSDNILEGVTRKTILELAEEANIPTEVRSVDRSELYVTDEAFFTGTGAQLAWIKKIDGRTVGKGKRGPITAVLQDSFFKIVHGEDEKHNSWCTKINIKQTSKK